MKGILVSSVTDPPLKSGDAPKKVLDSSCCTVHWLKLVYRALYVSLRNVKCCNFALSLIIQHNISLAQTIPFTTRIKTGALSHLCRKKNTHGSTLAMSCEKENPHKMLKIALPSRMYSPSLPLWVAN